MSSNARTIESAEAQPGRPGLTASATIAPLHPAGPADMLGDATAQSRLRMEGLAPFTAIALGRLTRTRYVRLLQAQFLFHSALAVAARRSGWSSVCGSAEKLDLIVSDLSRLGAFAPDWISDWRLGCPQSVLGAISVAQNATTGGTLIARQLDYLFGDSDEGRRFFISRGQGDSLIWRHLLEVLEYKLVDRRALVSVTAGAHAAFDLFETCLARVMPGD